MTDYKKKKQLLEENKDLYISDHDKILGYEALKQIIEAKKDYHTAFEAEDKAAMENANNIANSIRAQYGSYTGGKQGNEYNPIGYEDIDVNNYSSNYDDELDSLYESIKGDFGKFNYNYEDDPVYNAYKSVYQTQGNLAYDRALSENSLKTAGMYNTNANSAAMQAQNYYNSLLAAKIPELYEAAYERYYNDLDRKYKQYKDSYDIIKEREENDYSRYLDSLNTKMTASDNIYQRNKDSLDRIAANEKFEAEREDKKAENEAQRNFESNQAALDREHKTGLAELNNTSALEKQRLANQDLYYDMFRDSINDSKWRAEYNMDAHKNLYTPYNGTVGSGDLLDYARRLFNDYTLTYDDLKNLFGL